MACLPEEGGMMGNHNDVIIPNSGISVMPLHNGSPSPPPPPAPPSSSSQVPIYVKLNGYRHTSSPHQDSMASPTSASADIKGILKPTLCRIHIPDVNFPNISRGAFVKAFLYFKFGFVILGQKNIGAKAAHKILVKLTT